MILALGLTSKVSSSLAADPENEARERYERALKLYEERDFEAALVELKLAAELRPSYKLLYNIAQVRIAMNDYAAALTAYRDYLSGGGDKIPPPRREAVQREMKRLEQRVGQVTIETDAPGAEVTIDEIPIGTTPLAGPVLVNSGYRQIVVRHPDYVPQSRRLSVGGSTRQTLRFSLMGQAPPVSTSTPPTTPNLGANGMPPPSTGLKPALPGTTSASQETPVPQDQTSITRVPWALWGVTAALAAGGTVTGLFALSENSSLKDDLDSPAPTAEQAANKHEDASSKKSRVNTLAVVTDVLFAATLVSGGISLWLTVDSSPNARERAGRAEGLRVGLSANQVALSGTF